MRECVVKRMRECVVKRIAPPKVQIEDRSDLCSWKVISKPLECCMGVSLFAWGPWANQIGTM